jgi:MYXO-CTERM domain-containing protein
MGSTSTQCSTQLAQPDLNGDYLIEPTGANDPDLNNDAFVEVQAYYGINFIHDYMANVGLDATPIDVAVNWSASQGANAMYMGDLIVIGQVPNTIDLALENDVIYHEYGHHVFHITSGTGMFEMDAYGPTFIAGAIDEGSADYYSCTALDDPVLGEYWASKQPAYFPDGYMRNIVNDHHCPESLIGEVHEDSLVWSPFAWQVRELIGKDLADTLYLDVISHFPSEVNFPVATQVFLDRAALVVDAPTVDQIRGFAEARGLYDCERFVELTEATYVKGHQAYIWGIFPQMASLLWVMPGQMHYFLEVPADATEVDLREYSRQSDIVLLIRVDQPVEHTFSFVSGLSSTYDFTVDAGGVYDLLNPQPDAPFEPGHTYYIHPCNKGSATTMATIKGKVIGGVQPDGGTDGGGTDGGGTDGGSDAGADAGGGEDGGLPECPDGWDWTPQGCVPICKSGYKPKQDGDSWTCVPDDSGCGCGSGATTGLGLWLLFGLALGFRHRRRYRRRK